MQKFVEGVSVNANRRKEDFSYLKDEPAVLSCQTQEEEVIEAGREEKLLHPAVKI